MNKPSPVAQALAQQRLNELVNNKNQLANNVVSRLGYQPYHPGNAWEPFAQWCKQYGVNYLPARPTTVAAYVLSLHRQAKNFDFITNELSAIADLHDLNFGNPCATGVVNGALASIAQPGQVTPPRSWPKEEQALFWHLPAVIQSIIKRRDTERERHFHRKTTECGELRRQVRELQKAKDNGNAKDASNAKPNGGAESIAAHSEVSTEQGPGERNKLRLATERHDKRHRPDIDPRAS